MTLGGYRAQSKPTRRNAAAPCNFYGANPPNGRCGSQLGHRRFDFAARSGSGTSAAQSPAEGRRVPGLALTWPSRQPMGTAGLTAPEAVACSRLYLRRLLDETSAGPRLVRRLQTTPSMRTIGAHDDRATWAARKRRRRSRMPAVVHLCCGTSICTQLTPSVSTGWNKAGYLLPCGGSPATFLTCVFSSQHFSSYPASSRSDVPSLCPATAIPSPL